MKRRVLVLIVLSVLIRLLMAVPAMAVPTVSLNLMDSSIEIGDNFQVQVWSDGDGIGEHLLAFGFDVSMNSGSFFSYDGYSLGAGFDDDSFGPGNVAGSSFPGFPGDDVLLATLSFTALAEGTDTLIVEGLFDGMCSGLYYEFTGADIYDNLDITVEPHPVPVPGTMLLVSSGIIGIAGVRKRFKKA